ncbi:MAG TPA: sugar phosphate nucleotidyltransferase, partial [Nitrospinaceae bacterium]|nr:sugar phosphate nucleotidyltransferase [Nitrospinaceae bacterium]
MKILGMILAGGEGSRLFPLTQERAKPAVPFGGKYRLVDFVLSNLVNSNILSVYVLTQFKSQSLTEHLHEGWRFSSLLPDHFILPVPAQQRKGASWYQGTADAIFQNINLFEDHDFDLVAIFGADHIYRMDIRQMIEFHQRKKAD